jgi:hypothetical protein
MLQVDEPRSGLCSRQLNTAYFSATSSNFLFASNVTEWEKYVGGA